MTNLQQTSEEEWKDIPNYEGLYQVSSLGRIKSLQKYICRDGYTPYLKQGRVLKFIYSQDGYRQVMLYKKGVTRKSFRVSDLVFFTFNPDVKKIKGYEIDHVDQIKTNNALCNLKYITCRQNSAKRSLYLHKTSKFTGVSWCKEKNKWQAHIRIKGKSTYLGRFVNESDAEAAYQNKLKTLIV